MRGKIVFLFLLVWLTAGSVAAGEARLLRFADIHDDLVVFVYGGDLWSVSAEGGEARRLTTHEGMEVFPKISPDGRWIAFSAEYSGNRQVWVMPADGGQPRQLTFYNDVGAMPPRGGFDYQILDWTPDGKHVVFRGNRLPFGRRMGRPFIVPAAGGMETPLAIPESGGGMLSPDGKRFVYTPVSREFRTWKRHRGGRAQDVWIYDLGKDRAEQITDFDGTDNQPVWVGDSILFTSDREDGRLNLWSYDTGSKQTRRVTSHDDYDVLWPSAGPKQVVYECGGYLYRLDPAEGTPRKIPVTISGDFTGPMPRFVSLENSVNSLEISPTGKRVVVEARGDIFTVPAENGEIRNLTATPGVRELAATWSPDGRWVAYLSDRSGEYELYVRPHDGSGEERRVTRDGGVWRFPARWSPDSKKLAFSDSARRLHWVDVEKGEVVEADRSDSGFINGYRWSPDSRWLVYDKGDGNQLRSIYLYSLDAGRAHRVTDGFTSDYGAVFDPEGRYLYFMSDRDYNLSFSGYEFNYFYTNPTRLYAATLQADGPALFEPKSDEEPGPDDEPAGESDEGKKDEGEKDEDEGDDEPLAVDLDGLAERVVALPGAPGNYRSLAAFGDNLFFLYSDGNGGQTQLQVYSVADGGGDESETVLEGVGGFELSRDGKKILYLQGARAGIVDAKPGQKPEGQLDMSRLEAKIDPRAEWRQIFEDGWRLTRDWFYDEGMHGVDWKRIHELYEPLVEHVVHRGDLDYILGEMGGELNAGHFYVNWGDMPRVERRESGLLGAEISAHKSGSFRIDKIFPGENWHPQWFSPLTAAGVEVAEGDYILAVDGRPATEVANFYELLEHKVGVAVTLRVNDKPSEEGARDERVRPVRSEGNLRYLDWVTTRREMVDELSGGRIGYLHLPNTAGAGNRELRKFFYPQARKDAMIVDVRYNGGGFIPDRMIELVARRPLSFWARRGVEPMRTPGFAHDGPKACLINAYSSSGGDAFPYYFRKLGLGPLIGTRTWGGLIGLSGNPGFIDGGSLAIPTFRFLDTDGEWAVENVGVAPDVEVVDRPDEVARGKDPSLERAVEMLLESLRKEPPARLEIPSPPRTPR